MAGPKVFGSLVTGDGAGRGADDAPLFVQMTSGSAAIVPATADYDTGAGTDTVEMVGIALPASGGAVAGGTNTNPVQVGDAGGTLTVDAPVSTPVFVRLSDGSAAAGSTANPLKVSGATGASFRAVFDDIALGNNKYVALLFNADATLRVRIERIRVYHANLTAATGVIAEFELLRVSAFTTGTAVTPIADDPETDTLDADIDADTNSSSVTDVSGGLLSRFHRTGEELILAADNLLLHGALYHGSLVYERKDGQRGIILDGTSADDSGIAIKCVTSTTEGTINVEIEFTVE